MAIFDRRKLRALVREDRVHRDVYRDRQIFDLEMERIFGQAWVFVGHESQTPEIGDFFTTTIGRQPVVAVRHTDGKVHVLYNRCGHRGAVVENLPKGNAKHFRCCYHGWVFKTDGELASVPLKNGYPENFDLADPMLGMVPVARVESYRGFVFASLGAEGPGLLDHLGAAKSGIDDACDRSPEGEAVFAAGVHKYLFHGNWKFQIENVVDLYHPIYSHASTLDDRGRQFVRRVGDKPVARTDKGGRPVTFYDNTGVWAVDHGHAFVGKSPAQAQKRTGKVFEEYRRRMVKAYGAKRTDQIIAFNRHNTAFYPNLVIQSANTHVRVIYPIAPDLTEIRVYPILLKGAPEEMNRQAVRYINITHSPASLVQTDDLEAFKRCQEGLHTQGSDWVVLARGFGEEERDSHVDGMRGKGTHELGMRYQFRAWKEYMTA